MKKLLAIVLSLIIVMSLFPISVMAVNNGIEDDGVLDDGKEWGDIIDGDEFSINSSNVLTKYNGSASVVVIPQGVTSIASSAFSSCGTVTVLVIPEGVVKISSYAFTSCTNLKTISIPSTMTMIEEGVFNGCTGIEDVFYAGSEAEKNITVLQSGNRTFTLATWHYNTCAYNSHVFDNACDVTCNNCDWMRGTSDDAHEYTDECDVDCNNCGSIRVAPHKWENACDGECECGETRTPADHVYDNESDTICNECGYERDVEGAEFYFEKLKYLIVGVTDEGTDKVSYTASVIGFDETITGDIVIPDTVHGIPVVSIGDTALGGANITSVVIGNNVTYIDMSAFSNCVNLGSITIPDSVKKISSFAFAECTSLKTVNIGKGVEDIGFNAFGTCSAIESVTIAEGNSKYHSAGNCIIDTELKTVIFGCKTSVIPADGSVTSIQYNAFANCSGLTEIVIPNAVTEIGDGAFFECTSLKNVVIGIGMVDFGYNVFESCTSLTDIWYAGTETDKQDINGLTDDNHNDIIINATWHYGACIGTDTKEHTYDNKCDAVCNACGATRSVEQHRYDNDCDTTCNECGDVREVPGHAFDTIKFDDNEHWYECECGAKDRFNGHQFTIYVQGEDTHYKKCDCGATTAPTKHNYVNYKYTDDKHWTYCECGKEDLENVYGHGYGRVVTDTEHWLECGCGHVIDREEHDWTAATCTSPEKCKECGETRGDKIDHVSDKGTVTKKATCTEEGVRTYSCVNCGEQLSTKKIEKTNHKLDNGTVTVNPDCMHEGKKVFKCTVCKNTIKTDPVAKTDVHTYSNACDANCNICGASRVVPSHVYSDSCDSTCNVCGASRTTKHKYSNVCDKTCNVCGATRTVPKHTYKLTTTKKATLTANGKQEYKCTECGYVTSSSAKTIYKVSTIKLSKTSYTYDGKVKAPSVVVKDSKGNTLKKDTDYTVTYASGRKNAGTYKVTIKMKGKYSGTKTLTFKINPAKSTTCKFSLSDTTYTYDGKTKTPTVTVKNSAGKVLKKNTDYTVSFSGKSRKAVGTYKVTIKMKGNYTGTKTLTFKINPAKTTVSKVTGGAKKLTVSITKKAAQTTGYEVQYSTSSKFTTKTTKTKVITKSTTTKTTITKLTAKKTYYVRVRTYKTVNGKKYYSAWSAAKKAKTK